MKHKWGIAIHVGLREEELEGNRYLVSSLVIPHWDPEDPFCFLCGQKYINAKDQECPGADKGHFINAPDLTKSKP